MARYDLTEGDLIEDLRLNAMLDDFAKLGPLAQGLFKGLEDAKGIVLDMRGAGWYFAAMVLPDLIARLLPVLRRGATPHRRRWSSLPFAHTHSLPYLWRLAQHTTPERALTC